MKSLRSFVLLGMLTLGCGKAAVPQIPNARHEQLVAALDARGVFLPGPLDGARLLAKNVELQLPRGCEPLDVPSFVDVAARVNDAESDLLAACNVFDDEGAVRATVILIRHHISLETGDDAAAELRRAPGVLDVTTTTAGPTAGMTVGPEVVVSTNLPTGPKARPSASVYFGAHDGLYVLYAEVDGDQRSLSTWADTLASTLRPTPSARPIRWRAPTRVVPSKTAVGGHRVRLPEGVQLVPSGQKTFGLLVGDAHDPLDVREGGSLAAVRDEAGVALGGNVFRAKLLAPFAATPAAFAKVAADVRGVKGLEAKLVAAKAFDVARVDGTRDDGGHEVFAAFESAPGEVTAVRLVFTKEKWQAYAPFVDEMLASFEPGESLSSDPGPY